MSAYLPLYVKHSITMFAQEKETPLHIAAREGHVSIVEALIESKVDLNAVEIVRWVHVHFVDTSFCLLTVYIQTNFTYI